MTLDPTTRADLLDDGIFHPYAPEKLAKSRRPWQMVTGNDLTVPPASEAETLYDTRGAVTTDEARAVAKTIARGDATSFFAKVGTFGNVTGQLLDPKGVYFNPDDLVRDVRVTGRAKYEYVEVVESAFTDYLNYLQKRKTQMLRSAERQVQNG